MLATAAEFQRRQRLLASAASMAAQRLWSLVGDDFDAGWHRIGARLTAVTSAAQMSASRSAVAYVPAVLEETGQVDEPERNVRPEAFAGVASDGRPLDSLLFGSVTNAKDRVGSGATVAEALASSSAWLDMTVATMVFDAGRVTAGVATAARPHIGGQVRQLNPPSCARCAILAGRWYRWNAGFARHVHCDCVGIPASESIAGDLLVDPSAAVRADMVRGLSAAERQAFDEGADLAQMVNVHRRGGIFTAGGRTFTREGATRRGSFGRSAVGRSRVPRLTPEQIYIEAGDDRQEAIRLLRRFGYLD